MKTARRIATGLAIVFGLAAAVTADYQYDKHKKSELQQSAQADSQNLKQKYDRELMPKLVDLATSRCGDGPELGRLHGTLAARFIFDSNAQDDARAFLKSKNADPYHFGMHEMPNGDGYMSAEMAIKFAQYLLDNNIAMTAQPDVSNGKHQAELVYNGDGLGGHLKLFYQPAPSDFDGKDKPWIPDYKNPAPGQKDQVPVPNQPIPADGVYVPNSAALGAFLHDLMSGKYRDVGLYQVRKSDKPSSNPGNNWEIAKFAPNKDVEIIPHAKDSEKPQAVTPAASQLKLTN
jgi:hypothetical protein